MTIFTADIVPPRVGSLHDFVLIAVVTVASFAPTFATSSALQLQLITQLGAMDGATQPTVKG